MKELISNSLKRKKKVKIMISRYSTEEKPATTLNTQSILNLKTNAYFFFLKQQMSIMVGTFFP